jgi:hypothetical protein
MKRFLRLAAWAGCLAALVILFLAIMFAGSQTWPGKGVESVSALTTSPTPASRGNTEDASRPGPWEKIGLPAMLFLGGVAFVYYISRHFIVTLQSEEMQTLDETVWGIIVIAAILVGLLFAPEGAVLPD